MKGLYDVRKNNMNDYTYITFGMYHAQLIVSDNAVWVSVDKSALSDFRNLQLLKRIPTKNIKGDDYDAIYKIALDWLHGRK